MKLQEARRLARALWRVMSRYCVRCEIAGSIRREKPEVKDIEMVVIPRWGEEPDPTDLFGERKTPINHLHTWAMAVSPRSGDGVPGLQWIKPSTPHIEPWKPAVDGKYWRGYLPEHDIKLDVFLATPDNWGSTFLIRTGSREFGQEVMTHALRVGYRFDEGQLWRGETRVPTKEELDVFNALNLTWVQPRGRLGPEQVRTRRANPK